MKFSIFNFKFTLNFQCFNKTKFLFEVLILVGIFSISASLKIGVINAQVPPPTVACKDIRNQEFNSLRPYQASPCNTSLSSLAPFCGNTLTLHDQITVSYPGSGSCTTSGSVVTCDYNMSVNKPVTINLSDAKLPIMGNTENVPNSTTPVGSPPQLDDADKVNGYVSWYLNGVQNRAEDGSSKSTEYNTVNFSGPINKLMPLVMLDAQRIQTINNVDAKTNHNQIVVCAQEELLNIWGKSNPRECYSGNNTDAKADVYRLQDWNGNLNALRTVLNIINPLDAWNKRTPPLPWDNGKGVPFKNQDLYLKAYNEWQGKSCVIIPIINKVVCIDNPLVTNKYADLYSYIPLSATEDLKGQIAVDKVSSATSPKIDGVTVSGVRFDNQKPSILFFPHMLEGTQLAELLQKTFVAQSEQGNSAGAPTNIASSDTCTNIEVRSNPGDSLFATPLTGTLNYNAKFSCTFDAIPTCLGTCIKTAFACRDNGGVVSSDYCSGVDMVCCKFPDTVTPPVQTCTKDIYISLSTKGDIPQADNVWQRLVAGPQAIFKRIFPKTNTAGSVGTIMDIPGTTTVNYSGSNIANATATLNFPHIGGISEYFLKGIQTALRPKGYGEPITFADVPIANNQNPGSCTFDMNLINAGMQAAATKYNISVSLLKAIFEIESFPWIIDPSSYVCKEFNPPYSTSVGIAAVTNPTYNWVTCANERMSDAGMCGDYPGKISRCNFANSFELMARVLLANNGKYQACTGQLGNLDTSHDGDWYISACRYYGLLTPIQIPDNVMPENEKRPGGMLYCDFVGWKMGLFPPYPPKPTTLTP